MNNSLQQELPTSTALSADFPVSPTPKQEKERAVQIIAHFSPTTSDYCGEYVPSSQSLKMSQDYSQLTTGGSLEQYLVPMPKSGMMLAGKVFHAPRLGEFIGGKDSGLLPTPKHSDRLTSGVKTCKKGQTQHLSASLNRLNPSPGVLNPEFVERMMGFPVGWSDLNLHYVDEPQLLNSDRLEKYLPTALDSEDKQNRHHRLGQLGNAVVPQVACIVLDILHAKLDTKAALNTSAGRKDLEAVIDSRVSHLQDFYSVGAALIKIRDSKLYKPEYPNFYRYCRERFELAETSVKQLIRAVAVKDSVEEVLENYDIPLVESHCRELAKIKDCKERSLVLTFLSEAKASITCKNIRSEWQKLRKSNAQGRNPKVLPEIGKTVRIVGKGEELKRYYRCWGIVTAQGEFTVTVKTAFGTVETVGNQDLVLIKDTERVEELCSVLESILKISDFPEIKPFAHAIATSPNPFVSDKCWEFFKTLNIEH